MALLFWGEARFLLKIMFWDVDLIINLCFSGIFWLVTYDLRIELGKSCSLTSGLTSACSIELVISILLLTMNAFPRGEFDERPMLRRLLNASLPLGLARWFWTLIKAALRAGLSSPLDKRLTILYWAPLVAVCFKFCIGVSTLVNFMNSPLDPIGGGEAPISLLRPSEALMLLILLPLPLI